jgi:hypothetical protein
MELTRMKDPRSSARPGVGALALGVLLLGSPSRAQAAGVGEPSAPRAASRHGPRHLGGHTLEERVTMLSKGLGLDARQQSELRRVLLDQREEVKRVWADEAAPAAVRVKATEVITERTADRIRALLNEEQRRRYNPPKPPHRAVPGSARPSVEAWMSPAKPG